MYIIYLCSTSRCHCSACVWLTISTRNEMASKHHFTELSCAWSMQYLGQSKLSQGNLGVLNLNFWLLSHYSVMVLLKPTENPYRNIIFQAEFHDKSVKIRIFGSNYTNLTFM